METPREGVESTGNVRGTWKCAWSSAGEWRVLLTGGERSRKGVGTGLGVPGALSWSQAATRLVCTLTLRSLIKLVFPSPPPPHVHQKQG